MGFLLLLMGSVISLGRESEQALANWPKMPLLAHFTIRHSPISMSVMPISLESGTAL
jgi:hypothetical protein